MLRPAQDRIAMAEFCERLVGETLGGDFRGCGEAALRQAGAHRRALRRIRQHLLARRRHDRGGQAGVHADAVLCPFDPGDARHLHDAALRDALDGASGKARQTVG
jgi:hypothetical protein